MLPYIFGFCAVDSVFPLHFLFVNFRTLGNSKENTPLQQRPSQENHRVHNIVDFRFPGMN